MLKAIIVRWLIGLGIIIPYSNERDHNHDLHIHASTIHQVSGQEEVEQEETAYEETEK